MRSRARAFLGAGLLVFLLLPAVLASAAEKGKAGKVDINSASQSELESLPGVGPALGKRIIENRPYSSASGLSKAGFPEATIGRGKVARRRAGRKRRQLGRTVHGKYVTEAEAVRSGARVSHEKGEPEKP